ncbi:MAG: hypothetical protein IMF00_05210 [Proteobacteria bacterium]|jgi:hypothetical protein|nr:hypothetical protein [Pseudomonadota bacterium]MCK4468311.1 hypothetical protein [Desulfobacterales bacterium]
MQIILAILTGGLFGFVLHRVGAANPQNIINMQRLKDFHLIKVILFAIGFSSLILFLLLFLGLIDEGHINVKTSYIADTGVSKFPTLIDGIPSIVVAGIIAIAFMLIAWKLPTSDKVKHRHI